MSSDRVWFVAERFELLRDLLFWHGYALDPGPRDPNEWHELVTEDPPTGLLRLKAVRLADPDDEDSDFDSDITFSVQEFWTPEPIENATEARGHFLAEYSYHGHHHGVDQRYDFDPAGHPEMPYHFHPPGSLERQPSPPISVEEAVRQFDEWIAAQAAANPSDTTPSAEQPER